MGTEFDLLTGDQEIKLAILVIHLNPRNPTLHLQTTAFVSLCRIFLSN